MTTYIQINAYLVGPSIADQVKEYADAGKVDEDTRFFFPRRENITLERIANLLPHFYIKIDWDFDDRNVVLIPKESLLAALNNDKGYMPEF